MATMVLLEAKSQPGGIDTLKSAFVEVLPDTRAYDGCHGVTVHQDQDDPDVLVLVETWETREHYERYLAWRVETGLIGQLETMLAGPPSIRYFDDVDA